MELLEETEVLALPQAWRAECEFVRGKGAQHYLHSERAEGEKERGKCIARFISQ